MEEKRIDPWGSELIEDYGHLIEEFGLERFPESYKKVLKHRFFEREIVIAHRDFKKVMERIEKKALHKHDRNRNLRGFSSRPQGGR